MTDAQMMEKILNAMRLAWLEGHFFENLTEYMDCLRQVKERFND